MTFPTICKEYSLYIPSKHWDMIKEKYDLTDNQLQEQVESTLQVLAWDIMSSVESDLLNNLEMEMKTTPEDRVKYEKLKRMAFMSKHGVKTEINNTRCTICGHDKSWHTEHPDKDGNHVVCYSGCHCTGFKGVTKNES